VLRGLDTSLSWMESPRKIPLTLTSTAPAVVLVEQQPSCVGWNYSRRLASSSSLPSLQVLEGP